jgi:peptidoglycan/LPS O-acetylase OafA/YrhL
MGGKAGRILELDGVRGIAVLLVLIAHYASALVPMNTYVLSTIGVNIFFVLSGFLIGSIILDESSNPGFLKSFYFRRAARILPIYCVVVGFSIAAMSIIGSLPWEQHDRLLPAWVYLTFTTNIAFASVPLPNGNLLMPTWTVAVEEQFYLCAPLIIMMTPKRLLPSLLVMICIAAIGARAIFHGNQTAVEFLLPCRMDSLAIGIAAAWAQRTFDLRGRAFGLLAGAAATLAMMWTGIFLAPMIGVIAGPTLFSICIAWIMLSAIHGAAFAIYLRAKWLRFFGEISYGLYLIHQPVLTLLIGFILGIPLFQHGVERLHVTVIAAVISICLATLSWRFFERPIINLTKAILRTRSTVAAASQ